MRDRQRIVFLFYFESFLDTFDTTPFNEVTFYDRIGIFFNLRLKKLKKTPILSYWTIPPVLLNYQTLKVNSTTKYFVTTSTQHHRKGL